MMRGRNRQRGTEKRGGGVSTLELRGRTHQCVLVWLLSGFALKRLHSISELPSDVMVLETLSKNRSSRL